MNCHLNIKKYQNPNEHFLKSLTVGSGSNQNHNLNSNPGSQRNPEHRKSLLKDNQDDLSINKITVDITLI